MAKILMLTPEGEDVDVDESNFDAAKSKGLEPAFEMVDKNGENRIVRKSNRVAAEKAGLEHKAIYDAKNAEQKPVKRDVGALESAGRGFANAGTFGFADEIAGAGASPKGALKSLGGLFGNDVSKDPDVQAYRMGRDQYRADDDAAYKDQKASYLGGGAVPLAAQFLAPAGAAQSIGKAALTAGSQGAVQGLGGGTDLEGQADLTKGDIKGAGAATGLGAGIGGAVGAGVNKLSKAVPAAAKDLKDWFGYRATGGLKTDINKIYGTTPKDVGKALLEEGVIPRFGKRGGDQLESNIQSRLGDYSKKQRDFLSSLDDLGKGGVPAKDIADKITPEIERLRAQPGLDNQAKAGRLQSELDDLLKRFGSTKPVPEGSAVPADIDKNFSFGDALKAKQAFDDAGKFSSPNSDANAVEAARTMRKAIKNATDESIAKIAEPGAAEGYQADRMQSKKLLDALNAVKQSQKREQANKLFGITDWSLGAGGAGAALATHNPATAVGTALAVGAKKLGEKYGDATAANLLNTASKLFEKYGQTEGAARLNKIVGPDLAREITNAVGQ